ncbi:MAG: hypothetical protein ACI93R_000273 [Flavobacteriales bacterium]|jgi:hypothetical protein
MRKTASGFIAALFLSMAVNAQGPQLQPDVPDTYTVKKGDTLWDISGTFLENPWLWPEIWHVNTQIENPHLIYPGDAIRLIYLDGQPRLTLDTTGRLFKLEPQAHVISTGDAIDTIPLDEINTFLSRSRVVLPAELAQAPYVVSGVDEHLIAGKGDRVYVRGEIGQVRSIYGIYREGDRYVDPVTKEFLGVQAMDIGTASVRANEDGIATMDVSRTTEEVRIGDRLLRQEERAVESTFVPSAPSTDVEGVILAVEGGVTQVGKYDVVVLNRGAREGLVPGNVMAIFKQGKVIRDRITNERVKLPDEQAGLLMVFRSFEKVSLALVMEANQVIKVEDIVKNP